ncbi:unnamed protein product [Rhodiola kirilowii]
MSIARKLSSLVNEGLSDKAVGLFCNLHRSGNHITEYEISAALRACIRLQVIKEGQQLHCMSWKNCSNTDMIVMTSLVDMYSKCALVKEARTVFDEMPRRDVIATNTMISGFCRCHLAADAITLFNDMPERDLGSWNSIISGLGQNSEGRTALMYFDKLMAEGIGVDFMTMVSVLAVCADLAASSIGRKVHCLVIKQGFKLHMPVGNALVDMYAKCSSMDDARLCFDSMPTKNVVSWTSLIVGYGKYGAGLEAVAAFHQMEMSRVIPNKITFLGILYACSHAGLVQQGWSFFHMMEQRYRIRPTMEHYTCMVDLLARSGCLDEAYGFVKQMPVDPDAELLTALFSSCCSYMNVPLARQVGQKLLESNPQEAGAYMLLSNFYGLIGDLDNVAKVRRLMLDKGIRKKKACTLIEINRSIHSFESSDKSHPQADKIYIYLQELHNRLKAIGYVPNTSMVMQNVDDQTKEEIIFAHSERLAIAFGLLNTPQHSRITIVKNLRVCIDCHLATALISKMEGREIVARDSSRFHHFKNGVCSCGNHW